MKITSLKYDFCIKEIMDNEAVRKHFISDVLCIPLESIKSVRIMNTFLWKRYRNQKQGILDIQLELNDNTKINIEMQTKQKTYWKTRTVFYLAKMFTSDLRRGEAYSKAKKCIVITILDFNLIDSAQYHNVYMLRNEQGLLYTDILELHTIELKKKPDKNRPKPLDEWHGLFNAKTEEDLDMLKSKTKNLGILEAIKELKEVSLTERIRLEHEYRLKAKRDREAEDDFIRQEEREKGIRNMITALRDCGQGDTEIAEAIVKAYEISEEEARERL